MAENAAEKVLFEAQVHDNGSASTLESVDESSEAATVTSGDDNSSASNYGCFSGLHALLTQPKKQKAGFIAMGIAV